MNKTIIFMAALTFVLGNAIAVPIHVDATITADNHYALYHGNTSGVAFIGQNELGDEDDDGNYNWQVPEVWNFDMEPGDYIYIAGWGDNSKYAGLLGEFQTTVGQILTNTSDWEFISTGNDLDDDAAAPTKSELLAELGVPSTWTQVPYSIDHGSSPWGTISAISNSADWIWANPLNDDNGLNEYHIFRTQVGTPSVPEPSAMLLMGLGLAGFALIKRKK